MSIGPTINYISNNLDFNFDKQEGLIQSLEKQIENERKMRTVLYYIHSLGNDSKISPKIKGSRRNEISKDCYNDFKKC